MKFTDRQEHMVGHFLRQSGYIVKNLSPPAQTQTLLQVRERLYTELLLMPSEILEDHDLSVLLDRLRVSPTGWQRPAANPKNRPAKALNKAALVETSKSVLPPTRVPSKGATPSLPAKQVSVQKRRLLGVCIVLSERTDFPLRYVRAAFVTAGLTTGPFALIVYLGLYFEMSLAEREPGARPFAPVHLAKAIGFTLAPLALLYAAATAALTLLNVLYAQLASSPAGLGAWERFSDYNGPFFLASLLVLVPIAVLSGLPVPAQSRAGIRRCLEAGLSIYAVVLCMGIAFRLTGFLIAFAQGYNG